MKPDNYHFLFASVLVAVLAFGFGSSVLAKDKLKGNWVGESTCTVRPSPCNDEHVIYRVSEPNEAGDLKIQMDKIVGGKPEVMGTLDCKFDKAASTISCPMSRVTWDYLVRGNQMTGTLKLTDGTVYRKISVKKED